MRRDHPRPFAKREERQAAGRLAVHAPEQVEGFIEPREIVVAMDQQRLERGADVRSAPDAYPVERGRAVEHAPGVHVETRLTQDSGEEQEIGDQRALGHERSGLAALARVSARPRSICSRSPLTARMSS